MVFSSVQVRADGFPSNLVVLFKSNYLSDMGKQCDGDLLEQTREDYILYTVYILGSSLLRLAIVS